MGGLCESRVRELFQSVAHDECTLRQARTRLVPKVHHLLHRLGRRPAFGGSMRSPSLGWMIGLTFRLLLRCRPQFVSSLTLLEPRCPKPLAFRRIQRHSNLVWRMSRSLCRVLQSLPQGVKYQALLELISTLVRNWCRWMTHQSPIQTMSRSF